MANLFAIEDSLYKTGGARAAATDAAHFVWMSRANQLYNLEKEQSRIRAKVLFLPAKHLHVPARALAQMGGPASRPGQPCRALRDRGHERAPRWLFSTASVADRIKAFMER